MGDRNTTVLMIGEMLLVLQKFEQYLAAVLMSMTPAEANEKLRKTLLGDKATLGQLLDFFSKRTVLPEDFSRTFEDLLDRRNIFVHSLFLESWFDLRTAEGCDQLDSYMSKIREAAKIALHVIISVLHAREETGPLSEDARVFIEKRLPRIKDTAEPYFGDFTEDEYVAKVVTNACDNFAAAPRKG